MTRCTFVVIGALLCASIGASGDSYSISGRVVNGVTGEPVKRALVTLRPALPVRQQAARNAFTDAAGRFRFEGLEAGAHRIVAEKPQFENQDTPGNGMVQVGPSVENLELKLTPLAVIEGVVSGPEGEPLAGISVQALEGRIVDGRRGWNQSRSVGTDDRGKFRLWNLREGQYLVRVAGRAGGTVSYVGGQAPRVESAESVRLVYYGGGTSGSAAAPVTVGSGQQIRADFSVTPEPSFHIRGQLRNFAADEPAEVRLFSGADPISNRVSYNRTSGAFVVYDVVPGAYRLRAVQGREDKRRFGEIEVQVTNMDVFDAAVELGFGANIRVEVRCAEKKETCFADARLVGETGDADFTAVPKPVRDGEGPAELVFENVPPDVYRLRVRGYSGYVESVNVGGDPLAPEGRVTLMAGAPAPTVEVRLSGEGGTVIPVRDGAAADAGAATFFLLPNFPTIEGPKVSSSRREAFENVAPGEYTVYAFGSFRDIEYANPEVMRKYQGTRVTVRAGERVEARVEKVNQ